MTDPQGPAVEVEGVSRRFDGHTALDRVSLTVRQGEFFSMLGPSGCGKTTLLRILAGLDLPDEGTVRIGGVDAREIPAHRRPVNTVFQSYALFPHLSVRDNVAFGLRMKKVPPPEIAARVDQAMELVQIGAFADRKPSQISGGQKQRVALARCLLTDASILLLDDPISQVDFETGEAITRALRRWAGRRTILIASHRLSALAFADRIVVLEHGRITAAGRHAHLMEASDYYARTYRLQEIEEGRHAA
jgi:ABC-type Fe3+/spermidine/putrescine transport system ATPase subunit